MPVRKVRRMMSGLLADPDAVIRIAVIAMTIGSDGLGLNNRLNTISASVEKMRTINDVIGKTMASLQDAAALPERLRTVVGSGLPAKAAHKTTKTVGTV